MSEKGKQIVITAGTVILIIAIGITILFISKKKQNNGDNAGNENAVSEETIQTETTNQHSGQARSPLTGEWVSEDSASKVPVAVMYSNVADAMPQSSISYADIVFESLVEGGITRLCAVFEDQQGLEKIGPVRSCRTYYLFFAKEFEADYVHFGYSEYAKEYLDRSEMHALDGMVYCDFYRTTDRVAPHNAYTSWTGIMNSVTEKGYPTTYTENFEQPWTFNDKDETEVTVQDGSSCKRFIPGYTYNNPYFLYNEETKQYDRYQFDGPQIDAENEKQLSCKNILVKYVTGPYWPNGTPNYTIDGTGTGLYITDGEAVTVYWKKSSEYGPTKYYYKDGTEITLNQGKTWICQIEEDRKDQVNIEPEQ